MQIMILMILKHPSLNIQEGTVGHKFVNQLNPYEGRKVGVSKMREKKAEELQSHWWKVERKCLSCKTGFII